MDLIIQHKKQQGMSLIEVMVALLVVTIALGAAIQSVGKAVNNQSILREQLFSRWVASNRIAVLRLERRWPKLGKVKGESTMAGQKWIWEQLAEKTPNDTVRSITISVWLANEKDDSPLAAMTAFITH